MPPAPAPTPLHSKPCCGAAEGQRKVETGHLGHSGETEGTPSPGSMRRGALHPKGSGQITQAPLHCLLPTKGHRQDCGRGRPPLCVSLCFVHGVPSRTALPLMCSRQVPTHPSDVCSTILASQRPRSLWATWPHPPPALQAVYTSPLGCQRRAWDLSGESVSQPTRRLLGAGRVRPLSASPCPAPLKLRPEGAPELLPPPKADSSPQPGWASSFQGGDAGRISGASVLARTARGSWVRPGLGLRLCGSEVGHSVWVWLGCPSPSSLGRRQPLQEVLTPSWPGIRVCSMVHTQDRVRETRPALSTAACGFPGGPSGRLGPRPPPSSQSWRLGWGRAGAPCTP